jgi:hypothetical protein
MWDAQYFSFFISHFLIKSLVSSYYPRDFLLINHNLMSTYLANFGTVSSRLHFQFMCHDMLNGIFNICFKNLNQLFFLAGYILAKTLY